MYMHASAIRSLPVERISHYYLEAGHTQNEGDSMHAVIERASKHVNIYTPMQWYTLASSAKWEPLQSHRNGRPHEGL